MQYILSEMEVKDLLLCRKYIKEIVESMQKTLDSNPKMRENVNFIKNYEKYKKVITVSHPFISNDLI